MSKSVLDLKGIASAGGGLILDAKKFSTLDLKGIASAASSKQARIIIKNANSKSTLDLKGIASAGNGCVLFEF